LRKILFLDLPGCFGPYGPDIHVRKSGLSPACAGDSNPPCQTDPREKDTMFVREVKSDEKIKAESPELNPVPGFFEAGNLKQISKHNSYYKIKYTIIS
jgi:hypothetical protein